MTPDDKKRIEEIRKGDPLAFMKDGKLSAQKLVNSIEFLLAKLDEAHKALRDIAKQHFIDEMEEDPGDIDYAYNMLIEIARNALGEK